MDERLSITIDRLQKLEPLSNLSIERLEELVSLSYVEKLPVGVNLFYEGDIDNQTIYLLEGDVQISSADHKIDKVVTSKQPEAKYPLDDSQPRQVSCTALSRVELVRIDNSVLDYMMMWDQLAVSEEAPAAEELEEGLSAPPAEESPADSAQNTAAESVAESNSATNKATKTEAKETESAKEQNSAQDSEPQDDSAVAGPEVVESESTAQQDGPGDAVEEQVTDTTNKSTKNTEQGVKTPQADDSELKIPAFVGDEDKSWIRKMRHIMAFKNMPPANIKALLENMETIIAEKDEVIVRQGEDGDYYYVLTEGEALVTRTVELAKLTPGASFGEEALVSDAQRNATVTMTSDGMLMRLSKNKFIDLLKDPMLSRISPDEARIAVHKGAVWLDVRLAKEFAFSRLPKSINIPLHEVRIRLDELDKNKHYICCCSTGRRSSAAAFLLVQRGYNASVLNGGIKVMAQDLIKKT